MYWPCVGEDLCWLTGDWRILQRVDGHRWSLDDLVTAWLAAEECRGREPETIADIGCGIGSVLLMMAWRFPKARLVGIEAQDVSVQLARRSLHWNGVVERCTIHHGDLRDPDMLTDGQRYDLVTGTPPYFLPGSGTESDRVQFGPCHFEHRGGVEEYCAAAARLLKSDGVFIFCAGAPQRGRLAGAVAAAGLALQRTLEVIPRSGKEPLFTVHAARPMVSARAAVVDEPLVVRLADGRRTRRFGEVRAEMGMPP